MIESSATCKPYCGVETAAHFAAGATAEFHQLTSGLASYDLGWRARIAVTGEDRARWLNGMLTNNIRDLRRDTAITTSCSMPRATSSAIYMPTIAAIPSGSTPSTPKRRASCAVLDKFIIMDDVELTDVSQQISGIALQGAELAQNSQYHRHQRVPELAPMQFADLEWKGAGITLTRMASPDFREL